MAGTGPVKVLREASLSAVLAGVIATLIAYAGPLVIVFQAAAGLPPALLSSWVWAISIGSGVLGIALSLRYRVPVVIAWSAPGSALLVTLLPTVDFSVAVGAYLVTSVALLVVGVSGWFDKLVTRLPEAVSAAMLAGILFGFSTKIFTALPAQPAMVLGMFAAFFIGRRLFPRYAVVLVLVVGVLIAWTGGLLASRPLDWHMTVPVWTTPRFEWQAIVSISLPLLVVALTGQFVPGIALLRASGYATPAARPVIGWSAAASAVLAPFGCHGLNLGAFTAAICTGREAHEDPARRYVAGVAGGVAYLVLGCFAATVLSLFAILPRELIAALAGLALFPAIASSLAAAMQHADDRDAALATFIVSASGMSLFGLGAAFWGLLFGLAVHALLHWRRRRRTASAAVQASSSPASEQRATP